MHRCDRRRACNGYQNIFTALPFLHVTAFKRRTLMLCTGRAKFEAVLSDPSNDIPEDSSMLEQLPCHEVDGFGDCLYDGTEVTFCDLRPCPIVWVVIIYDRHTRFFNDFYFHKLYGTREEAHIEARRLAACLVRNQNERRREFWKSAGQNVLEDSLRYERVLFGPLTNPGLASILRSDKTEGLSRLPRKFQDSLVRARDVAMQALQVMPSDVQRLIFSFAYPHDPEASESSHVVFKLQSPPDHVKFSARWIQYVPAGATVNDVCKMVHEKVWKLATESKLADWLCRSEPALFRRRLLSTKVVVHVLPPKVTPWQFKPNERFMQFVCQAQEFKKFSSNLSVEEEDLPVVEAIAFLAEDQAVC